MGVGGTTGIISQCLGGGFRNQGRFGCHRWRFDVRVSPLGFRTFLNGVPLHSFVGAGLAFEGLDPSADVPLAVEGTHVVVFAPVAPV